MKVNWGVSERALVRDLGDDLWLLECNSKSDVKRIVSSDRFLFGSSKISFDKWVPSAGRTEVLRKQGLGWFLVSGIPLHLLSSDLFKVIGNWCGGFVDACTARCPLGAVRLKLKKSQNMPKSVPLLYDGKEFIVSISEESSYTLVSDCGLESKMLKWIPVETLGRSSTLRSSSPRKWNLTEGQCSKEKEIQQEEFVEGLEDLTDVQMGREFVLAVSSCDKEVAEIEVETADDSPAVACEEAELGIEALGLRRIEEIVTSQRVMGLDVARISESKLELSDGPNGYPRQRGSGVSRVYVARSCFSEEEETILEGFIFLVGLGPGGGGFWPKLKREPHCLSNDLWAVGSQILGQAFLGAGGNIQPLQSLVSRVLACFNSNEFMRQDRDLLSLFGLERQEKNAAITATEAYREIEECEKCVVASVSTAELCGLQTDGSQEVATEFVAQTAKEFFQRRATPKGKSRTELELRRLGSSGLSPQKTRMRRSANRYGESIPIVNES
ncbi:hypothetical protein LINGRAHAP2_LOCUS8550 [Linum grandiflorum]